MNTTAEPPRYAAIYTRMSVDHTDLDDEKHGAGVERQLQECLALAEKRDYTVPAKYMLSDNDISATTGKRRPGFEQLLALAKSGEISTVIVWHPDRLYRKLSDLVPLLDIANSSALAILSVQAGEVDLNTPSGRMVATILGGVATHEGEHRTARQKLAYKQRAMSGEWHLSHRPFGYDLSPSGIKGVPAKITRNDDEAKVLEKIWSRYYADGISRYALIRELNAQGITTATGKLWTITQLRAVLGNPHYAGIVTYKGAELFDDAGQSVKATWPAIIDRSTYKAYMSAASRRKVLSTFTREATSLLSGIPKCGVCGAVVYRKSRADQRWEYACSSGQHVTISSRRLDQMIVNQMAAALMFAPQSVLVEDEAVTLEAIAVELQDAERRRSAALDHEDAGLITHAEAAKRLGAVKQNEESLIERRDAIMRRSATASVLGELQAGLLRGRVNLDDAVNARKAIRQRFEAEPLERQRSLVKLYLGITINRQAHPRRIVVEHKVATSLNEAEDAEHVA